MKQPPFYAPQGSLIVTLTSVTIFGIINHICSSYGSAITNTAEEGFRAFINESYVTKDSPAGLSPSSALWYWSAVMNSNMLGWLFGNFITPALTDGCGRRNALILSNVCMLIGNTASTIAIPLQLPSLLFLGRVFSFAFTSVNFSSITLIIMESVTVNYRGPANFIVSTSFMAGAVLGLICGMDDVLGHHLTTLVGVCSIGIVLATIASLFVKESPKYLLLVRHDRQAALESIVFYQGMNVEHEKMMDEIMEEEVVDDESDKKGAAQMWDVVKEIFARKLLRNSVILGLVAMQLPTGPAPIVTILLAVHFPQETAELYCTLFSVANFAAGIAGIWVTGQLKTRTLLFSSAATYIVSLTAYVMFDRLAILVWPTFKYGCLLTMLTWNVAMGIGVGTLPKYIAGELMPQRWRSTGQSMVFVTTIAINFCLTMILLPAYESFNIWSFLIMYVLPGIACLAYLWRFLPESKDKETPEIIEELRRRYGSHINAVGVVGV